MDIRLILVISLVFGEIYSLPAIAPNDEAEEAELIQHIEEYVMSVPMINFEGDVVLLQFTDRENKKSDYRHVSTLLIDKIVYERNTVDIDKEVVVLRSSQDHIETKDRKRIFVVLRKNNVMGDRRLYYVAYLYIKDPVPDQLGIHNFGNRKVAVEWDFWDDREHKESKSELDTASACLTTIFVPCRSMETVDFPLPKKISGPEKTSENPSSNKIKTESLSNKTFILPDGDTDKYYEFFSDLDQQSNSNNLGRRMHFSFRSMSKSKMGKAWLSKDAESQVLSFMQADLRDFHKVIQHVVEAGMGLMKSFQGLYGGLGTSEARAKDVLKDLIHVDDAEALTETMTKDEVAELEDQLKLPSSGGLGGMVNADEMREAEEEGLLKEPQGRRMSAISDRKNGEAPEGPYIKYGWNTDSDPNSLGDPFVGFGACRYHKVTLDDLKGVLTTTGLITLYQRILKTQCIKKDTKLYQHILSAGIINIADDGQSFQISETCRPMRQEKLPQKERVRLYRGMELAFFSAAYVEEAISPSETKAPDNAPISRNVFTLGKMMIKGLASKTIPNQHSIKLGRNIVKTLRIALSKLAEDDNVSTPQEKETNFNDRVYLVGILQFVIHSYDAIFTDPKLDVQKAFELFYVQNRELLEDKINLY